MLQVNSFSLPSTGIRAKSQADSLTIYRDLKAAIAGGTFAVGSRLPTQRALAARFNAARNTVRKTMDQLATEGLIVRQVGRGTFVAATPAPDGQTAAHEYSLAELLEARLLFEPSLPDLVVERATADDLGAMERSLEAMRSAETWVEFKEAKYRLHLAVARAARNRFIVFMFEQILASRRVASWGRPGGHPAPVAAVRETAYRENLGIVEALKARDSARASEAIRNYLMRTLASSSS